MFLILLSLTDQPAVYAADPKWKTFFIHHTQPWTLPTTQHMLRRKNKFWEDLAWNNDVTYILLPAAAINGMTINEELN